LSKGKKIKIKYYSFKIFLKIKKKT